MTGTVRRSKHVLFIVASLLLISGALRIITGAGPAIAFAEEQIAQASQVEANEGIEPEQNISAGIAALQDLSLIHISDPTRPY